MSWPAPLGAQRHLRLAGRAIYASPVRRLALLLVLSALVALELEHYQRADEHAPARSSPAITDSERARRALTLLDFWAEQVVPGILLEHARAHAAGAAGRSRAAGLERRARRALLEVDGFGRMVAQDPALARSNSVTARAVRAAGGAWSAWARAVLDEKRSSRGRRARSLADMEAGAIRLHQAAYALVDRALAAGERAR